VPRHGIQKLSRTLDTVGLFARSLDDLALAAEQLIGYDPNDPDTRPRARAPLVATLAQEPPLPPKLALVRTAAWDRADAGTHEAFAELAQALGADCETCELPDAMQQAWDWHRTIMEAEMAANLDLEWQRGRGQLSAALQAQLGRGREILALDYQLALARLAPLQAGFEELFNRFDAIVTPSAPGTAPALASTGDPAFCTLWSLCGMPALNLPLMAGADGLPLGVQLVGPRDGDARLLRTARWLVARVRTGET
jgi:Asp-tRNA(Asn)/Glu-tRNA(Gln) amidotransferase A subunit family amidase